MNTRSPWTLELVAENPEVGAPSYYQVWGASRAGGTCPPLVAVVPPANPNSEADAALIALAPKLRNFVRLVYDDLSVSQPDADTLTRLSTHAGALFAETVAACFSPRTEEDQ